MRRVGIGLGVMLVLFGGIGAMRPVVACAQNERVPDLRDMPKFEMNVDEVRLLLRAAGGCCCSCANVIQQPNRAWMLEKLHAPRLNDDVHNAEPEKDFDVTGIKMLGIRIGEPGPALRAHLGLKEHEGILVDRGHDKSIAKKLGIEQYDVLMRFSGEAIKNLEHLRKMIADAPFEKEIELTLIHRGARKTAKVVFAKGLKKLEY